MDEGQSIVPDSLLKDTESPKKPDATRPPITTTRFRVYKTSDVPAKPFATPNPAPVNIKNANTSRVPLRPHLSRYGWPIKQRQIFDL